MSEAVATEAVTTESAPAPAETSAPADNTILGNEISDKPVAAPSDWPEDWRKRLAGDDEKRLKRLERFTNPGDIAKSFFEAESALSKRAELPKLPENATEKQIEEYRKAVGVPLDGKYDIELGNGFVWSDADKPLLDDFQKYALEANMPQGEVKKTLAWYATLQQKQAEQIAQRDQEFKDASDAQLREMYGADYRRNLNAAKAMIERLPAEVAGDLLNARTPSGKLIGASPEIIDFLVKSMFEINPASTVVPASGGDPMKNVADRKLELKKEMLNPDSDYWKGPMKDKLQQEYRDLINAEEALKRKAG